MASAAGVLCPCPVCKGEPVSSVKVRSNHMKIYHSVKEEVATVSNVPEEREKSQTEEEEIEVEFLSELELDEVMHQSVETPAPQPPGHSRELNIYPVLKDGLFPRPWGQKTWGLKAPHSGASTQRNQMKKQLKSTSFVKDTLQR